VDTVMFPEASTSVVVRFDRTAAPISSIMARGADGQGRGHSSVGQANPQTNTDKSRTVGRYRHRAVLKLAAPSSTAIIGSRGPLTGRVYLDELQEMHAEGLIDEKTFADKKSASTVAVQHQGDPA
jgi:hypothetical protein